MFYYVNTVLACCLAFLLVNNRIHAASEPTKNVSDWRLKGFKIAKELKTNFKYYMSYRNDYQQHALNTRQLLGSDSLPACEIGLKYKIVSIDDAQFTSLFTIINNRELSSNFQLVFKYIDQSFISFANSTGALALSRGGVFGAPIRLVDDFESGSAISPTGGSYSFTITSLFISPPAAHTINLLLNAVNINGLTCMLTSPVNARLEEGACIDAYSMGTLLVGNTTKYLEIIEDSCTASWCCGYQLDSRRTSNESSNNLGDSSGQSLPLRDVIYNSTKSPVSVPSILDPPNSSIIAPPPPPSSSEVIDDQPLLDNSTSTNNNNTLQDSRNGSYTNNDTQIVDKKAQIKDIGSIAGAISGAVVAIIITIAVISRMRSRNRNMDRSSLHKNADRPKSAKSNGVRKQSMKPQAPLTIIHGLPMTPHKNILTMQQVTRAVPDKAGQSSPSTPSKPPRVQPDDQSLPQEVSLLEPLGSGAFGTVYKGMWGGKFVAVKVLQTACSTDSKELQSFRQEVAVLSRIRHPRIIAFLAACTVPPDICIIEELAEGGSLATKLHGPRGARHNVPLPLEELVQLALDIAEAMESLHPKIVHRDLKSQNILLDSMGRAKVCDFGIAKFKDRTFVSTANGQAGTPSYMAPELFDRGQVTEKVDVYSFGVLLWEMMTGKVPWGDVVSPLQIIYYVGVLQKRPELPDGCHGKLRGIIERCWDESPTARPQFKDIVQELKSLQEEMQNDDGGGGVQEL